MGTIIASMIWHAWRRPVQQWLRVHWAMLALSAFVVWAAGNLHYTGHTWGDDFTLYLRQAGSLVDGNVGQVIADNHFNVDNAAKPGFSPYVYPWGFPLLLAPFYRVFGLDYAALKMVEVACLVAFLWAFRAVLGRRMRPWLAFATTASVATTLAYLAYTDKLVSENPYMAAAAITLWWLDHLRNGRRLHEATRRQLVVLGLLAMLVFNVRREGLAIVAAIATAQLLDLRGHWHAADRWKVATPLVTFAGSVVALQLMLPSTLAPSYDGAGLHQTWRKLHDSFQLAFAHQVGVDDLTGLGLGLLTALVVVGVGVRLWRCPGTDAPLVVYAVGSMTIVGMIPATDFRYLLGVTPYAIYFAAQAVASVPLPRAATARHVAPRFATAALAAISVMHLTDLPSAISAAGDFNDAGRVLEGPESPHAQAAFGAVRTYTHQDDVIAFFKVRALTFYTDRRGVQSSDLEILRRRSDYFLMRRGTVPGQPLVDADDAATMGWTQVWHSTEWVLWRLPLYESG